MTGHNIVHIAMPALRIHKKNYLHNPAQRVHSYVVGNAISDSHNSTNRQLYKYFRLNFIK
jgi:hypothetical protein